jgi:hypothetical protein
MRQLAPSVRFASYGSLSYLRLAIKRKVDDLEAYSRIDNVIVYGLPETAAEVIAGTAYNAETVPSTGGDLSVTSELAFIQFCHQKLKVEIAPGDISVAHRLAKPKVKGDVSRGPRPMIVRFCNRKAKLRVLAARKELRKVESCKNIYINEHLTQNTSQLFKKSRAMVKNNMIQSTWTWSGKLFIKTLASKGGRIHNITCEADLSTL